MISEKLMRLELISLHTASAPMHPGRTFMLVLAHIKLTVAHIKVRFTHIHVWGHAHSSNTPKKLYTHTTHTPVITLYTISW